MHITAAEPYTTKELLEALAPIDLDGQTVALVHYGEPNAVFAAALSARAAHSSRSCRFTNGKCPRMSNR